MEKMSNEKQFSLILNELKAISKNNEELNQNLKSLRDIVSNLEKEIEELKSRRTVALNENIKLKESVKRITTKINQLSSSNNGPELEFEVDLKKKKKPKGTKNQKNDDNPSDGELSPKGKKHNISQPPQSSSSITIVDYNDSEILLLADGTLSAASIGKIIHIISSRNNKEERLMNIFLMTYNTFLTPVELFKTIEEFWDKSIAQLMNENSKMDFDFFRGKIANLFKTWLTSHPYDFTPEVLDLFINYIEKNKEIIGETTIGLYNRLIERHRDRIEKRIIATAKTQPPLPIIPTSNFTVDNFIFVIDPTELARQITLMDESVYKAIVPRECMGLAWSKPSINQERSPNILKIIDRFNRVSGWATKMIVSEVQMKRRKTALTRIIKIAQKLRELHNYHSLMAIIAALESASIARMKKTWEAIDSIYVKSFQEMKMMMSAEGSYRNFRHILKAESTPAIPYVGVYLGDLTFIEDGNPDKVRSKDNKKDLVNLLKMKMLAGVIEEMRIYQHDLYNLEAVAKIQNVLREAEQNQLTQQELFELSLKAEPRPTK